MSYYTSGHFEFTWIGVEDYQGVQFSAMWVISMKTPLRIGGMAVKPAYRKTHCPGRP